MSLPHQPSSAQQQKSMRARLLMPIIGLQGKLIVPYVLLTLILAAIGTYVTTRLVTSSLRDRITNQLVQASRVAADTTIRRERMHVVQLRELAFTVGVSDAVVARDVNALQTLLTVKISNQNIEAVVVFDRTGQVLLVLAKSSQPGQYLFSEGFDFTYFEPVRRVLAGEVDKQGDKFTGVTNTIAGQALFTVSPVVNASGELVGGIAVGTSLKTLVVDTLDQTLSDIILLDNNRQILATNLPEIEEGYQGLIDASKGAVPEEANFNSVEINKRSFRVSYTNWKVRGESLGWMGVILPNDYIASAETRNRRTFLYIFSLGTAAMILIGYILAQLIARPILRLRDMSQAVAGGDLNQSIGLHQSDEIGELAGAFDTMTLRLRERTAEAASLYAETVQRNIELADTNARLQAMQLQLIQSEKLAAVGQLTAGIVHDVKNPLAVIKGLAEVLQDDATITDETRHELQVIRESAEKANRIVSDLLKFARQSQPEMQIHDLRETVEASLRLTTYLIREARIQLVKEIPEQMMLVTYDPQQIEQVLINMIHNAIQAMPNRGTLQVRLNQVDGSAVVAVQDTGIGISPENLLRIFDPFFTTKPEGVGTGLGLSVSYGIIANHHGHIEVDSEVGKGTKFTIYLPVDRKSNE
jgi:signal transduction histidine kinase